MQMLEALAPLLIPIGLIALLIFIPRRQKSSYGTEDWRFGGWIIVLLLFVGWGVAAPVTYFGTLSTVADLEAFHGETLTSYEYAIDETRQIVLTDDALTDFSDQAASERIAELRDRIAWYNQHIARLDKFESIPFIGAIVADVPDELQPIALPR